MDEHSQPDAAEKDHGHGPPSVDPKIVTRIVYGLYIVCGLLLVVVDLFRDKEHVHFSFESWFGFYCIYGLVACVVLVLAAKALRVILMREEDYYDR